MKHPFFINFIGNLQPARFGRLARRLLVCFILLFGRAAYSNDFFWVANPVDNNFDNPANWSPPGVPNFSDAAHFNTSSITDIISQGNTVLDISFDPGAEGFTISALPGATFQIDGSIVNSSGVEQNFVAESNADDYGLFSFWPDDSGTIQGPVTFTQQASNGDPGQAGAVQFLGGFNSSMVSGAGDATYHNLGSSVAGGFGGWTNFFYDGGSAESCTIINDGGTAPGAGGGSTVFELGTPSAARATLIANGGSNGGTGGSFTFYSNSSGGTARVELFGNGYLDISSLERPRLTIGSLEGDGVVYLGSKILSVGSSPRSTTFSGLLQPGTPGGGGGTGTLEKIGDGTLTLTVASVYTGGTTVLAGTLVVANATGSATGTGPVSVNAGTLGGSGIIAGAVTVGTGSGTGAFLAPAYGGNTQLTLTIQGSLTFNSDSTYTYTFRAKRNRSKIDKVIANGVTINSGATISLSGTGQGQLTQGMVLTLIKNTAATPIVGTFSNLPDGGIVIINGNNFQASYSGGDGNDLTLTVVP